MVDIPTVELWTGDGGVEGENITEGEAVVVGGYRLQNLLVVKAGARAKPRDGLIGLQQVMCLCNALGQLGFLQASRCLLCPGVVGQFVALVGDGLEQVRIGLAAIANGKERGFDVVVAQNFENLRGGGLDGAIVDGEGNHLVGAVQVERGFRVNLGANGSNDVAALGEAGAGE